MCALKSQQLNMSYSFAADRTLGKLSKWLRIMGFDTHYESGAPSRSFFEKMDSERIFLTRTNKYRKMYEGCRIIFIKFNDPLDQLEQVINEVGITNEDLRPFSRCLICNVEITEIEKDAIFGQVPDYVWETHDIFQICPECRRIFW